MYSKLEDVIVTVSDGTACLIGVTERGLQYLQALSNGAMNGGMAVVSILDLEPVFEGIDHEGLTTLTLG